MDILITNPHKRIENDLFKELKVFWLRKDAEKFCSETGYSKSLVTRIESRFQIGYIIGTGRNHYLTD